MRPTFSIIFFTVMSGAGYGLWLIVGLIHFFWPGCVAVAATGTAETTLDMCGVAAAMPYSWAAGFFLVSAGLLSSLAHLGQPRRAWRALSQWRSSWLSREGIAAILTYLPALSLLAIWYSRESAGVPVSAVAPWTNEIAVRVAGGVLAAGCVLTIICTANIYACLKPIRAWHNRFVVPSYFILGLFNGLLLFWILDCLPHWNTITEQQKSPWTSAMLLGVVGLALVSGAVKRAYWRHVDRQPLANTGDATGLGALGTVRSFEQPHTEENYLTREMGFQLARKHSRKLRLICLLAGFGLPGILALLSLGFPALATPGACLALLSGTSGIFVERWLFFAEAKHVVMLYYGARKP